MAMDHPKISIITSVYKTGHYLPLTVQSILAQTFTDFELLLVDDGSPDDSGAVADELAKTGGDEVRMTHDQMAKYMGSAREVVSRMLKYFAQEGWVRLYRGGVQVLDRKKLQALARGA